MSSPVAEFRERVAEGHAEGDAMDLERGEDREPMILVANGETPRSDVRLLCARLEQHGYEIGLERHADHGFSAYTIWHPGFGSDASGD